MKLRREVGLYATPPAWWYIFCWHDLSTRMYVYYPIGIHWIAKWIRSVYWWLNLVTPQGWEREFIRAHTDGYQRGEATAQGELIHQREIVNRMCERHFNLGFREGVEAEQARVGHSDLNLEEGD